MRIKDRSHEGAAASKQAPIANSVSAKLQTERFKRRAERDNRFWAGTDLVIARMLAKEAP